MMIDRIRELRYARPFKPFTIHLRDGRRLKVPLWHVFAISPDETRVVLIKPYQSIQIDSIADLTVQKPRSRRRHTNGHDH